MGFAETPLTNYLDAPLSSKMNERNAVSMQQLPKASIPLQDPRFSRCESAISTITIYDKENKVLKPYLRKYMNVEHKVSNCKLKDITYQLVKELTDPVNDREPLHAPECSHVSFFCL